MHTTARVLEKGRFAILVPLASGRRQSLLPSLVREVTPRVVLPLQLPQRLVQHSLRAAQVYVKLHMPNVEVKVILAARLAVLAHLARRITTGGGTADQVPQQRLRPRLAVWRLPCQLDWQLCTVNVSGAYPWCKHGSWTEFRTPGGGQGWSGPIACVAGSTCVLSSQWYSQCLPIVNICSNGAYGQCGGSGWGDQTCCPAGYKCTYSNVWYSQCLPG